MSYFAGILLLMIVVAVLIIAVSIIIYNKRLDKIAKGELHDTHNPIPEPKTTAEFLYKTILLVIVSISLISISTLSGMVISLRNDVDNMRNDQSELSNELYTLRSDLEEQARLVASSDWSFENVDYNTMTTDVNYSATLKQYSDDTEVTLSINGNNILLERTEYSPGTYSGKFHASFFDDLMNGTLIIKTAGISTTETVQLTESLVWDFFPFPGMSSQFTTKSRMDGGLKYDGKYQLHFDDIGQNSDGKMPGINNVTVTYISSGKELATVDITKQALSGEDISLVQGLEGDSYLLARFVITMDNGYRIIDNSIMVIDSDLDPQDLEDNHIEDADGNVIWTMPKKY
ncbi:MAG: hypothetical protein IKQ56_04610 [Lachnospiraceae bacterium]|nr:hypothetical protein [Lachnospiraceae bacterium]